MWHTRLAAASPPGLSTSSCPTYERFQHLRVAASLTPLGRSSLLLPSDAWSQESLRDWIPSSRSFHAKSPHKSWFRVFLTSCMHHLKIPKIWRRALVVAISKPEKPLGGPKNYRPISLLCVPFKILERLIYTPEVYVQEPECRSGLRPES